MLYILRVIPVAKLNANNLRNIILKATYAIVRTAKLLSHSFVINILPIKNLYTKFGGTGKAYFEDYLLVFLVYMYAHIFKNVQTNDSHCWK